VEPIRRLSDIISQLFGVRTAPRLNNYGNTVGITAVIILQDDPRRVGAIIVNNSLATLYVSPLPDVSSTKGIYVAPGGGSLILNWEQDFELVSHKWYAIAGAALSAVTVLENRIQGAAS